MGFYEEAKHVWEQKPCQRCKYVRRVRVQVLTPIVTADDGTHRILSRGEPRHEWAPLCEACDLDAKADLHERKASKLRSRAATVRSRRARVRSPGGARSDTVGG